MRGMGTVSWKIEDDDEKNMSSSSKVAFTYLTCLHVSFHHNTRRNKPKTIPLLIEEHDVQLMTILTFCSTSVNSGIESAGKKSVMFSSDCFCSCCLSDVNLRAIYSDIWLTFVGFISDCVCSCSFTDVAQKSNV